MNSLQLREGAKADQNRSIAHGRREWFECACCPPNIMRTFASLDHLAATATPEGLQIHQFTTGTWSTGEGPERLAVSSVTDYPFDGLVRLTVEAAPAAPRRVSLRIPGWSRGTAQLSVGGTDVPLQADDDYATIDATFRAGDEIELRLDLTPRFVGAHHRLDASRGSVALERGPLVYAIENEDQEGTTSVDDAAVDPSVAPVPGAPIAALDSAIPLTLVGSAVTVSENAAAWPYPVHGTSDAAVTRAPATWTAIPYYAWGNRTVAPMRVWLPLEAH